MAETRVEYWIEYREPDGEWRVLLRRFSTAAERDEVLRLNCRNKGLEYRRVNVTTTTEVID